MLHQQMCIQILQLLCLRWLLDQSELVVAAALIEVVMEGAIVILD